MISLLMPYRGAGEHRRRMFEHNTGRWRDLADRVELCVGEHSGDEPFNLALAVNRARKQAIADVVMIHGCDHLPPDRVKLDWIEKQVRSHGWTSVYAKTGRLTQAATTAILRGEPTSKHRHSMRTVASCVGIMAMRTDIFDALGGMDERFAGWGCEDAAFRYALRQLYPPGGTGDGRLWTMWHPKAPRNGLRRNSELLREYWRAAECGEFADWYRRVVKPDVSGDDR